MGATPHANGGALTEPLATRELERLRGAPWSGPGTGAHENDQAPR